MSWRSLAVGAAVAALTVVLLTLILELLGSPEEFVTPIAVGSGAIMGLLVAGQNEKRRRGA